MSQNEINPLADVDRDRHLRALVQQTQLVALLWRHIDGRRDLLPGHGLVTAFLLRGRRLLSQRSARESMNFGSRDAIASRCEPTNIHYVNIRDGSRLDPRKIRKNREIARLKTLKVRGGHF